MNLFIIMYNALVVSWLILVDVFMTDTVESHIYMNDYLMDHCSSVKNELQLYLLNSYVELSRRVHVNKCKTEYNDFTHSI